MWYECLPALGIICGAMWVSGKGLDAVNRLQNGGKSRRVNVDPWDEKMMARDKTITGSSYIQKAP